MNTFSQADEQLQGRNKEQRKLENNTYLVRLSEDAIAVRLHATNILTYHRDGWIEYNSGGWHTVTTKDRLRTYGPLSLYSERGQWYFLMNGTRYNFEDGMLVRGDKVKGAKKASKKMETAVKKDKTLSARYAKRYVEALIAGEVSLPSGGDCWHCYMKEEKTQRPLGEVTNDNSHIRGHITEDYFVPSLAWNALTLLGGSIAAKEVVRACQSGERSCMQVGFIAKQIEKTIRRYVNRQLGYQA